MTALWTCKELTPQERVWPTLEGFCTWQGVCFNGKHCHICSYSSWARWSRFSSAAPLPSCCPSQISLLQRLKKQRACPGEFPSASGWAAQRLDGERQAHLQLLSHLLCHDRWWRQWPHQPQLCTAPCNGLWCWCSVASVGGVSHVFLEAGPLFRSRFVAPCESLYILAL